MPDARPIVLFAGGGSGGHIFPNLAVVERLSAWGVGVQPWLLVSGRAVDREVCEAVGGDAGVGGVGGGVGLTALPAEPWRRSAAGAARFVRGYAASRRAVQELIRRRRVAALVATGGFVSGPAVSAARSMGIPTAVITLDAKVGWANRVMARKADAVFAAMENSGLAGAEVVGYPLRFGAVSHLDASSAKAGLGLDTTLKTLLVFAGSQGAATINAAMAEWMTRTGVRRVFEGWQVLHYTGSAAGEREKVAAGYAAAGVPAVVEPFGHRMGLAWASAEVVVARAGAGSVAEAWSNAAATVFLPYPYHRDEHQRLNVLPLSNAGGAVLLRDRIDPMANVAEVSGPVTELMHNATKREAMRRVLRDRPMGDGASALAAWVQGVIAG